MKKNSTIGYVILGTLFVMVSVIAFAVPVQKTTAFWIAYAFTTIAILAQIIIWNVAFCRDGTLKSKFLGLPVLQIGVVYLIVQLAAFAIYLFNPTLPTWSAVVVCVALGGISSVCMISADVGRGEIERVSATVQEKTFFIKQLQTEIELQADAETDIAAKSALMQLVEKIRYSDPVSNEQIADIEDRITAKIAELKKNTDKTNCIAELNSLFDERNRKCKLLK